MGSAFYTVLDDQIADAPLTELISMVISYPEPFLDLVYLLPDIAPEPFGFVSFFHVSNELLLIESAYLEFEQVFLHHVLYVPFVLANPVFVVHAHRMLVTAFEHLPNEVDPAHPLVVDRVHVFCCGSLMGVKSDHMVDFGNFALEKVRPASYART